MHVCRAEPMSWTLVLNCLSKGHCALLTSSSSLCPVIYGHLVSCVITTVTTLFVTGHEEILKIWLNTPCGKLIFSVILICQEWKLQSNILWCCLFLACESCSSFSLIWRQTETHRQEQCSSERRPTHLDGGRPGTGQESDVTGNTECTPVTFNKSFTKYYQADIWKTN